MSEKYSCIVQTENCAMNVARELVMDGLEFTYSHVAEGHAFTVDADEQEHLDQIVSQNAA